jgi:hypothetical protein
MLNVILTILVIFMTKLALPTTTCYVNRFDNLSPIALIIERLLQNPDTSKITKQGLKEVLSIPNEIDIDKIGGGPLLQEFIANGKSSGEFKTTTLYAGMCGRLPEFKILMMKLIDKDELAKPIQQQFKLLVEEVLDCSDVVTANKLLQQLATYFAFPHGAVAYGSRQAFVAELKSHKEQVWQKIDQLKEYYAQHESASDNGLGTVEMNTRYVEPLLIEPLMGEEGLKGAIEQEDFSNS